MAPKYELYTGFTVEDALEGAGCPAQGLFHEGEPPVEFFTQAPKDSPAIFSTVGGTRPFRTVDNPTYQRTGEYWWAAEIQRVCDEFRRNRPDVCRSMEPLQDFWGLYKYFDAYDIYLRGAQNLWNVIHTLVWENLFVQGIVDRERMELEAYDKMQLFEDLAFEVLKDSKLQRKLIAWNKDEEPDVLKAFEPRDLLKFEGYGTFHEYFLQAMRSIFERHYECMRNGLPLVLHNPPASDPRKDALRVQYNDPSFDPFMDKFDIPNQITFITEPVVVDGTSKTAALRAGYIFPSTKKEAVSREEENTIERFSSAPTKGGDPNMISKSPGSDKEARIYPGNSHVVGKKLMGCIKPEEAPGGTSPDNILQRGPSVMGGYLPRVRHHTASGRFNSQTFSTRQRLMPSVSNMSSPDEVPFANQVPPRALTQGPRTDFNMAQQPGSSGSATATGHGIGGAWQRVGSDEIHGPKAVFRKGSTHGHGPRRFSNAVRPHNMNNINNTWTSGKRGATGITGYVPTCLNTGRNSRTERFDPCHCTKCKDRDRAIYIRGLSPGIIGTDEGKERLSRYFMQFGAIEQIEMVWRDSAAGYIKFVSPDSVIPAVTTASRISIEGVGDSIMVLFRSGSRHYIPRPRDFHRQQQNTCKSTYQTASTSSPMLNPSFHSGTVVLPYRPQGTIPTAYAPPPMPFPPRAAPGSPTPAPRRLANRDGQGTMDYGTMRVRPGKAKYIPIPSDWRRESKSLQPVDEAAPQAPPPSTADEPETGNREKAESQNQEDSPPEVEAFEPAISTTELPSYPKGTAEATSVDGSRNEPFPAYRDLMSGNQSPEKQGGSRSPTNTSISQKSSGTSVRLNPGAQDFVPPSGAASSASSAPASRTTSYPTHQPSGLPRVEDDGPDAPFAGQFPPQVRPLDQLMSYQMHNPMNPPVVYMRAAGDMAVGPFTGVGNLNNSGFINNDRFGHHNPHPSQPQIASSHDNGSIARSSGGYRNGKKWKKNNNSNSRFNEKRDAEGATNPVGSGSNEDTVTSGKTESSAVVSTSTSASATANAKKQGKRRRDHDKPSSAKPSDRANKLNNTNNNGAPAAVDSDQMSQGKKQGRNFTTKHHEDNKPKEQQQKPLVEDFPALPPPPLTVAGLAGLAAAASSSSSKSDTNAKAKNKPA